MRFSTREQRKGNSYERQKALSEQYAKTNGLTLSNEEFFDEGISAFKGLNKTQDKALGVFINAVKSGKIKAGSFLLVESLDRISRETVLDALDTFKEILELGINIVTLLDGNVYTFEKINTDFASLMLSLLVMSRAHEESVIKSERISKAWSKKRSDGNKKVLTARTPAWLKVNNDYTGFVIDEGKAKVINKIFDMVIDGHGVFHITNYLNKEGVSTFGNAEMWHMSYVRKILLNRACIGEYQPYTGRGVNRKPEGEPIENYYPVIIEKSKFYHAQTLIKSRGNNSGGRKGNRISNLFTHLMICSECGNSFVYVDKGKGKKSGEPVLKCNAKHNGLKCDSKNLPYQDFEDAFLHLVKEVGIQKIIKPSVSNIDTLRDKEVVLKSEIEKIEQKYLSIEKQIEDSDDLNETFLKLLNKQIVKLEADKHAKLKELDALEMEMGELDDDKTSDYYDQMIMLKEYMAINDDESIYNMRSKVRQVISRVIKNITVKNDMNDVYAKIITQSDNEYMIRFMNHKGKKVSVCYDGDRFISVAFPYPKNKISEDDKLYFMQLIMLTKEKQEEFIELWLSD